MSDDYGQADRDYWSNKYDQGPEECDFGEHDLYFNDDWQEFHCTQCDYTEEYDDKQAANEEAYNYG